MEHRLQTTSSSSSNLNGWTKYAEHKSETNWSSWSRTKPADQPGRSIESRHIPATYKTQYNYHGYYTSAKGGWWHFCPGAGRYFHGTNFYRIETGWRDSPISPRKMPQAQTCGGGLNGCNHSGRLTVDKDYVYKGNVYYFESTRQVQTGGGYDEFRYKDTNYTYDYYRYGAWSQWKDDGAPAAVQMNLDLPERETELLASQAPVPQIDTESRTL